MSQNQWFIRLGEVELGPLTPQQVKQLAENGKLTSTDLVRMSDNPDWQRADVFKGLLQSNRPFASSSEYDIDDMLDTMMELHEDNPDFNRSPQSIWPDCPSDVLDELLARFSPIHKVHDWLSPKSDEDDERVINPDLSVLKEGYRPTLTSSYELTERLGKGGFGEVWRADNHRRERSVAFKFCTKLTKKIHLDALHNELSKIQKLDHPGIVRLEEEHLDASIPFLQYEFIDGIDLGEFLCQRSGEGHGRSLSPNHAADVILKLTEIMAYVHSQSIPIVHRDLKPANILVSNYRDLAALAALGIVPDVRLAKLKVMDFGLAGHSRRTEPTATSNPTLGRDFDGCGTGAYMSPQQRDAEPANTADDVYSIGVMWFELLTGRIGSGPPSGMRWNRELKSKGMSDDQLRVLFDCLEDELEHRIPNAIELEDRIRAVYSLDEPRDLFNQVEKPTASRVESVASLTVEMAKVLGKELLTLSPLVARSLIACNGLDDLAFDRLQSLSSEAVQALACWSGKSLSLNGLTTLSQEVAQVLAGWKGQQLIFDNGLTTLSPGVAKALARWKGAWLHLDALTILTPEDAQALSSWSGESLSLNGLKTLSQKDAETLAGWKGKTLSLGGLTSLTPEVAQALSRWRGEALLLLGLTFPQSVQLPISAIIWDDSAC